MKDLVNVTTPRYKADKEGEVDCEVVVVIGREMVSTRGQTT